MLKSGPLRAGVAEIDLQPPLGLATGDGAPFAMGYATPLYVKALLLENGHDAVAIVALDMLGIDRPDAMRAARQIEERCGIPAGGVVMTCSHTHVAPSMLPTLHTYRKTFNPGFDEAAMQRERDWVDHVVDTVVEAVCQARANLQDASAGATTANLPWLVFNRRRHTRDFGVWTHWMGIPNDQVHDVEGPIDPEFGLLVIRNAQHKPMAMMWNFTGHNSFSFGDKYSGDLAYTVQVALDERIGEHIPCLYAPGCSGNTNYFDYQKPEGLTKATAGVADAIMAIYRECPTRPVVKLGSRQAELEMAQRDVTRYWWKDDIDTKYPGWHDYGPLELERFKAELAESETLNKHFTEAWTKSAAWSRFCICEYPVTDWGRFEVRALRCIYGHTFHQLKAEKIGLAYCAIDVGIAEGCSPRIRMSFTQCMHNGDPVCYQIREVLDEPQEVRLRSEEYGWRSMADLPRTGDAVEGRMTP